MSDLLQTALDQKGAKSVTKKTTVKEFFLRVDRVCRQGAGDFSELRQELESNPELVAVLSDLRRRYPNGADAFRLMMDGTFVK
jgi:hypothetical protein